MLPRSSASFLACTLIAVLARADALPRPELPIVRRTLANGMTVVIAPDPRASSVHVTLRFAGGAADETREQAGYTRLLEGLFADGSVHVRDGEHARMIEAAGGWTSSQTTLDELVLSTEVPPEALDLELWLDAERMAGLADAITAEHVAKERDTIASAYRAAYVDEPYALVPRALRGALWPAGSANRNDVLGDPAVLAHASVASVRVFERERIQPGRATLVIAGRVSERAAGALVRRYFEWIPRGTVDRAPALAVAPLPAPVHINLRDPIAQIAIGYRVPADHRVDLEVLARVIAGVPGSVLSEVADGKRASDVRAEVIWHRRGAELIVHVTPAEELDRDGVEALADHVRHAIGAIADAPPTDELVARAGDAWLTEHLLALETLSGRAATYWEWAHDDSIDQYVRSREERVTALRASDIAALARAVVAPSSAATVVGLPEGR